MLTTKEKTELLFVHDNVVHLRQGIDLLRSISDVQFVATIPPVFANCAGVHIRHIIDQFNCFFDGVQCGRIDYDRRARNRDIEQIRELAIKSLEQVIIQMEKINDDSCRAWRRHVRCRERIRMDTATDRARHLPHRNVQGSPAHGRPPERADGCAVETT